MKRLERCPECELSLILITETGGLLCPMCGKSYTSFSFSYVSALETMTSAARAVVAEAEAREITRYGYEDDHSDWVVEVDMPESTWNALIDTLDALDKEEEDSDE